MSTPDHHPVGREETLFAAAVELPVGERAAYLDQHCGGDAALRQRIEALLAADGGAGDLLAMSATRVVSPDLQLAGNRARVLEKPGDHIGHYHLLAEIGTGGCGVVYLAEQEKPVRRQVALKVIKLGMDTRQVVARFEFERQVLASMDHPNIAQVFDAGETDSGRPYFVMELVKGDRITRYCDLKKLPTHARLELFLQACSAIEHAHQKGLIHRDIKPSNILVSEVNGAPLLKAIDFGIAKATNPQRLTDGTQFTGLGTFVGTPAYMSPEQAGMEGVDVDTRSDIYSLGVLLYELLTGTTPLDSEALHKMGIDDLRQAVREQESPAPSRRLTALGQDRLTDVASRHGTEAPWLVRSLRGDLDWIVMKALEKDRTRRYESVGALAADIRRYLGNQPVFARPPSAAYLFRKLVRRHRLAFAAGAVVTTSLIVGLAVSTRLYFEEQTARLIAERSKVRMEAALHTAETQRDMARKAEAEALANKQRADQEAASVKAVSDLMRYDILMQSRSNTLAATGREVDTNVTLNTALDRDGNRLENRFEGQPLAEAAIRLAMGRTLLDLNDGGKGIEHLERAYALRKAALGADDAATVEAMTQLADACRRLRRYARALELLPPLVDILKAKQGAEAPGTLAAMLTLAGLYEDTGDHSESLAMFDEVLRTQKAQRVDDAKVAETYRSIGLVHQRLGNAGEALSALEQALKLAMGAYGNKHSLTVDLTKAVGRARCAVQKWDEGIPLLEQALQTELENRGADAPEVEAFRGEIGRAFESAGKTNQALALYQAIFDRRKEKFGADHRAVKAAKVDVYRTEHGPSHAETFGAMFDLGRSYQSTGQYDDAIEIYEKALKIMKATRRPDDIGMLFELATLGIYYADTGQLEKALATYDEVIQSRLLSIQAHPSEPIGYNVYLVYNLNMKQEVLRRMGRYEQALAVHDEALKWAKKLLTPDSPHYRLIGSITSESIGLHEHLFASRKAKLGIEHTDTKAAISALITFCADAGQPASAEKTLVAVAEELTARQADFLPDSPKRNDLTFYFYKLIQLCKQLEMPDKAAEWQAKLDALTVKPQ